MNPANIRQSGGILAGILAVLSGAVLAGAAAATPPRVNDPADIKAIKAIQDDIATRLDGAALVKHYAPDAAIIGAWSPDVVTGRAQIGKYFDERAAKVRSIKSDFIDRDILSDGTFACSAQQVYTRLAMKDGKAQEIWFRQHDALRKVNGTWQVVQQHVSLPVDSKSLATVPKGRLPARGPMDFGANPLPGPAISPAQAKADARAFVEKVTTVLDTKELLTYFGPQDHVQLFDLFYPGTLRGRKEIFDAYDALLGTLAKADITMTYFSADSDGLIAVQLDKQDVFLTKKDGGTMKFSLRESDCLRRVDGRWVALYQMISFPVDPATGKAIGGFSM